MCVLVGSKPRLLQQGQEGIEQKAKTLENDREFLVKEKEKAFALLNEARDAQKQRLAELELAKDLPQPRPIRLLCSEALNVELDGDFPLDGCQDLGDASVICVLGQVLLALGA